MNVAQFLVDTSALSRMLTGKVIGDEWEQRVAAGLVAVCPLTELELLYSARSPAHRAEIVKLLHTAYGWAPMPDQAFGRAWEVQGQLTERGTHRSAGPVDLLVAATAELHGLALLHYDRDFETIAEATGQSTQWLARPGTLG